MLLVNINHFGFPGEAKCITVNPRSNEYIAVDYKKKSNQKLQLLPKGERDTADGQNTLVRDIAAKAILSTWVMIEQI